MGTTPKLPVQQFIVLAICRFAEPVIFTSVFPYLPEMIRSLGVQENEVAKWVGFTSAIFSICQCLTAVPWGSLSDHVGRKPIILSGLFVTMTFSLMFGFSTSLPMAIIARACIGLGNGNVGIIRTVVAELVPHRELQPRAFSLMPLVWNIGSIFGPAFGGALANPAKKHPGLFGNSEFFKKYPFALPNMAISILFIVGIFTGFLFLQETAESRKDKRDYGLLLGNMLKSSCSGRRYKPTVSHKRTEDEQAEPLLEADPTLCEEDDDNEGHYSSKESRQGALRWSQILSPQSNLVLLAYASLSLHTLAYDSLFPVFLDHPKQDLLGNPNVKLPFKYTSGFGMDAQAIGILYTFTGIIGMFVQFLIFPYACQKYGVHRCLKITAVSFPIIYSLVPFAVLLPSTTSGMFAVFMLLCGKLICGVFAFPCCTILLTNSAPSLRVLGTLNGVATSVSAIGRALGPAIIGSVFSLGMRKGYMIIPWWTLACMGILSAIPVFWIVEKEALIEGDANKGESGQLHGNWVEVDEAFEVNSNAASSEDVRPEDWAVDDPPPLATTK